MSVTNDDRLDEIVHELAEIQIAKVRLINEQRRLVELMGLNPYSVGVMKRIRDEQVDRGVLPPSRRSDWYPAGKEGDD